MTQLILQAQGGGMGGMLFMLIAMFAIMYFFMIRPQQKRRKEIQAFQNALKVGDRVISAGGIYGTVKRINLEKMTIELEIAKGTVVEIDKNYIYADSAQQQQQQ